MLRTRTRYRVVVRTDAGLEHRTYQVERVVKLPRELPPYVHTPRPTPPPPNPPARKKRSTSDQRSGSSR